MNIFNRLFMILLSLVVLVASLGVLLVTLGWVAPATVSPSPWFRHRLNTFVGMGGSTWDWTIGIACGLIVLSVLLFLLETRRPARRASVAPVEREPYDLPS